MDLQGVGYSISIVSVLFLGLVAWPGPADPGWHAWAVIFGMGTSVLGMVVRFISHRRDRHDLHKVERKAEQN